MEKTMYYLYILKKKFYGTPNKNANKLIQLETIDPILSDETIFTTTHMIDINYEQLCGVAKKRATKKDFYLKLSYKDLKTLKGTIVVENDKATQKEQKVFQSELKKNAYVNYWYNPISSKIEDINTKAKVISSDSSLIIKQSSQEQIPSIN